MSEPSNLVLIHGLGASTAATWAPLLAGDLLAPWQPVAIALPGFGGVPVPEPVDGSIEAYADYLIAAIAPMGPVALLGHSMGGSIAILAAARRPDLVTHLIVAEPNLDPGTGQFSGQVVRFSEAGFVARGHAAVVRGLQLAARRGEVDAEFVAAVAMADPRALHRAAVSLRAERTPSFRELAAGLPMPRCYVGGGRNPLPAGLEGLGFAVRTVPGAGHVMMRDDPATFAQVVRAFLEVTQS